MCYIKCRYEMNGTGPHSGECLFSGANVPEDATCQILDKKTLEKVMLGAVRRKIELEINQKPERSVKHGSFDMVART